VKDSVRLEKEQRKITRLRRVRGAKDPALNVGSPAIGLLGLCRIFKFSAGSLAPRRAGTARIVALIILLTIPTLAQANQTASQPTWATESVCYEIFVRSFFDSDGDGNGDLNGLTAKLDYLNDGDPETTSDLGVNCLWLLPVAEAFSYHGYDTTDYYTVESDYGTNDDFKRFMAEAHERGIYVLVDLVLNHTSNMHPWFESAASDPNSEYRDWYIWSDENPGYRGPWGQEVWHGSQEGNEFFYGIFWEGMPDLNYRNPAVTAEADKISEFWLTEMGVDGFRLDAIKHLIEDGRIQENTPETHDWLRDYNSFLDITSPEAFTIGEIAGADATTLEPYHPDQTDSLFAFKIGEAILTAANYGETQQLISAVEQTEELLPDQRYGTFLTNHDQPRTMTTLGELKEAKVAATALLTLPGLPFIYYGEEIGMSGDKPDERIRTPMQWSDSSGGGFTAGTPWEPLQDDLRLINVAAQQDEDDSLWTHYQQLIGVRATSPALQHGSFTALDVDEPGIAAYIRKSDEEAVLVVLNFGRRKVNQPVLSAANTGLEPGTYAMVSLLDREPMVVLEIGGNGEILGDSIAPSVNSKSGAIFRLEKVSR
jgi:alpha-amylase